MSPSADPDPSPRRPLLAPELRLRIVSALVMAGVVLIVTWMGGFAFALLCALGALAIIYEWNAMTRGSRGTGGELLLAGLALVLAVSVAFAPSTAAFAIMLALTLIALLAAALSGGNRWAAGGLAYAGIGALSLVLLRNGDMAGLKSIVFLFAVVWTTDIMAYFVGRAVGGPKLAPRISPGKTWSGAAGGAGLAVLVGLAFAFFMDSRLSPGALVVLSLCLSVVSQAGDLFESALKRRFAAKDSGSLIPGHGGIMDRVDGLVAAALAMYVAGAVLADAEWPAHAFFMP